MGLWICNCGILTNSYLCPKCGGPTDYVPPKRDSLIIYANPYKKPGYFSEVAQLVEEHLEKNKEFHLVSNMVYPPIIEELDIRGFEYNKEIIKITVKGREEIEGYVLWK